jgi:hypothetical protein
MFFHPRNQKSSRCFIFICSFVAFLLSSESLKQGVEVCRHLNGESHMLNSGDGHHSHTHDHCCNNKSEHSHSNHHHSESNHPPCNHEVYQPEIAVVINSGESPGKIILPTIAYVRICNCCDVLKGGKGSPDKFELSRGPPSVIRETEHFIRSIRLLV